MENYRNVFELRDNYENVIDQKIRSQSGYPHKIYWIFNFNCRRKMIKKNVQFEGKWIVDKNSTLSPYLSLKLIFFNGALS